MVKYACALRLMEYGLCRPASILYISENHVLSCFRVCPSEGPLYNFLVTLSCLFWLSGDNITLIKSEVSRRRFSIHPHQAQRCAGGWAEGTGLAWLEPRAHCAEITLFKVGIFSHFFFLTKIKF